MDKVLIIFIKNPLPGKVKTRLAKDIGDLKALHIYNYLLNHTKEITTKINAERLLFYSDYISLDDDWPIKKYTKLIQDGEDLGIRMFKAFEIAFKKQNSSVIIIGSDCLELSDKLINEAFSALKRHDFVIGPAKDGGYYLLGMNNLQENIFKSKHWSTPLVFTQTLSDINQLQKTVLVLPVLSDIDTIEDLGPELLTNCLSN